MAKGLYSDRDATRIAARVSAIAERYDFAGIEARYDLPAGLLSAIACQESKGDARAVGPPTDWGRAKGMFQFIDATGRRYGVRNPFNVTQAANGAARYCRDLLDRFDGDVERVIAAYNRGEGGVRGDEAWRGALPAQTRDYVPKVAQFWEKLGNIPESLDNMLDQVRSGVRYARVRIDRAVEVVRDATHDLLEAGRRAGILPRDNPDDITSRLNRDGVKGRTKPSAEAARAAPLTIQLIDPALEPLRAETAPGTPPVVMASFAPTMETLNAGATAIIDGVRSAMSGEAARPVQETKPAPAAQLPVIPPATLAGALAAPAVSVATTMPPAPAIAVTQISKPPVVTPPPVEAPAATPPVAAAKPAAPAAVMSPGRTQAILFDEFGANPGRNDVDLNRRMLELAQGWKAERRESLPVMAAAASEDVAAVATPAVARPSRTARVD